MLYKFISLLRDKEMLENRSVFAPSSLVLAFFSHQYNLSCGAPIGIQNCRMQANVLIFYWFTKWVSIFRFQIIIPFSSFERTQTKCTSYSSPSF